MVLGEVYEPEPFERFGWVCWRLRAVSTGLAFLLRSSVWVDVA